MSVISRAEVREKLVESLKYNLLSFKAVAIFTLMLFFIVTSIFFLFVKLENRHLTIDLQKLNHEQNKLQVEWTQILLEHSTLASPILVEQKARTKLQMVSPSSENSKKIRVMK